MKPNSYILVSCFLLLLLIECKQTFAQHEYDVWYFGDFAGVDFTSGTPVVLTNGQVSTLEEAPALQMLPEVCFSIQMAKKSTTRITSK